MSRHLASMLKAALWMTLALLCSSKVDAQILHTYTLGEGYTLSDERQDYSINLRGYIQPYFEVKRYEDPNLTDNYSRFRMRRIRLRLSGEALQQKIEYRIKVDLSGISETGDELGQYLFDGYITYNFDRDHSLTVGQKVPSTDNRELQMGSQSLQLVERSRVTSVFSTIREFGLFYAGRFRLRDGSYLRPTFEVTNGDGINAFAQDRGGLKVGGRIDYLPFGLFYNYGQFRQADLVREQSLKLVIGGTYSYNMGMSSRRGRGSGDILYLNDQGLESLPNYAKFGVDFLLKYRGFSMIGEFMGSVASVPTDITQRVRNDGSISTNFEVDGEQNVENYVKGRMMLGKGYNIQAGYVFPSNWSIDARYCHLDADEYSFMNNGTFYNRPNYYTIGVTKYLARDYGFKIQASITYAEADEGSNDIYSRPITGNEWIARVITTFAF
ncbi:MAG: porin [Flavobacteriia bacterium]|nr:porin [Flavobacteriia bacterium]